ncbi:hypothetical protein LCGC14_1642650 [marine sediment metagenome]|uniref:Uncharacterized protein n=1 Tax=marine sediment metagenome TaxID=412755 RepID=A0A0F9KYX4_9ZZZZ
MNWENWYSLFGKFWAHADIHFTPTVWAIGFMYDNRKVTTREHIGKGVHVLLGPIVIRIYTSYKPQWSKWKEREIDSCIDCWHRKPELPQE